MEHNRQELLAAFNRLYHEMDNLYHAYARRSGISDTALWLLYALCESGETPTQRELCAAWYYAPQTLNSALKSMERGGLLRLLPMPGSQKNKRIALTQEGEALKRRVVGPLIEAEIRAGEWLSPDEGQALIALTARYVKFLRHEIHLLPGEKGEDNPEN